MKTAIAEGADPTWSAEYFARRKAAGRTARGYFAETMEYTEAANTGGALATGVLYGVGFGVAKGDLISAMDVAVQTIGATLTLVKFGLLNTAGVCVAVSADVSAAMLAIGKKACPMVTPYRSPDDDYLFALALSVGTTGPALKAGPGQTVSAFQNARAGGLQPSYARLTGQSDIVVGNTYVLASSSSDQTHWAGMY
jgi:hypothetical protein